MSRTFSLLWKEWREQRWKLAFGCLVLGAFAGIGLRARVVADELLLSWVCLIGVLLLPVMSATGLVPAERAEGTLETLLALPVRRWRVLAAKTVVGVLLCVGPLAAAAFVSVATAAGREMSGAGIVNLFARSAAATLSLFAWMLALTVTLPGETRAGLVSLGVLVFWLLAAQGLATPDPPPVLLACCPFVFTFGFRGGTPAAVPVVTALAAQAAVASALWAWAVSRVGTAGETGGLPPGGATAQT